MSADHGTDLLPGRLQASFVVEAERFAWWGVTDPVSAASAAGLPGGQLQMLPMALPDGATVRAAEVPAVLVPADEGLVALARLAAAPVHAAADESVRVWAHIADAALRGIEDLGPLSEQLPTAGHAALGLDRATIWSAGATVEAVVRAARPDAAPAHRPVRATLRPYQRAGVAWMQSAEAHGGAVLADEMGLGKTLQAIALLAGRGSSAPHLVVCPTSVVGNWRRELARFAPDVPVLTYSGARRADALTDAVPGAVVLTSYGLLRTDADALTALQWDTVVLDEAQQVKNPESKAARAARDLQAQLRIAMTGTPVENRLDELWSLLAFTTPDVLGSRARFRSRFVKSVEQQRSQAAASRLHELVGPHILRRRKQDVLPELPPKLENTVLCALSDEQERLYRATLDDAFSSGLGSGIQRRGRVLAMLTRLKQVCNHPEQVQPDGTPLPGRSGKLDRATEMLAEILDNDERALVFTQYRETGELLARHLASEVTGKPVPFLHGGLSQSARDEMIRSFQEDEQASPILVLSLRAAGFGLTLTRANHVLHFDRWWNPAVEDQASDRVHRIGQTRTVSIHTLVTERSLEESIDELHAGKRAVAGMAIGETTTAAETDLARLSDEQLRALLDPARASA